MLLGQKLREVHLGLIKLAIEGAVVAQRRHVHRRAINMLTLEGGAFIIFLEKLQALEVCSVGDEDQWAWRRPPGFV